MIISISIAFLLVICFYWCIFSENRKNKYIERSSGEIYTIKEVYTDTQGITYYKIQNIKNKDSYIITDTLFYEEFKPYI